jgi:hypothetical protein
MFVGEGNPPCRILYSDTNGDAYPDRLPPPSLMPLAGSDGDAQVKWLDPAFDFHSRVEFKYPVSFRIFRDFYFYEDAVGGELMVEELCKALGPGEPAQRDLLQWRTPADYEKDEDWPFNGLLIAYVVRAVLSCVLSDLRPGSFYKPLTSEAVAELNRLRDGAIGWLERCRALTPMHGVDADTKGNFRTWLFDVMRAYKNLEGQVYTSATLISDNLGNAINHTIRCMATEGADTLDDVPHSYLMNLARQNHWKAPTANNGKYRHFDTAIHQMLGNGSGPQGAAEVHSEDLLLLQLSGDLAFFDWHSIIGCVLHFWIDRDALARCDFSRAVATLECD